MKKGKGAISKCKAEELITLPTQPGSGSGSGEQPTPIPPAPGSGSGEQPGSGSGPSPPMGEGMQCSCKCNCPDGGGECECDCNCPMQSSAMNCASGFTRVCPMMGDTCPEDMDMMCPITPMNAQTRMMGNGQAYGEGKGCQCVPDFLMSLVTGMPPAAGRMEAMDRMEDFKNEKVKLGKKTCTCSFSLEADGAKCSGTAKCDKKCSGSGVVEIGMYTFSLKMKKGKGAISKCKAEELITLPTQPGSGSGSGEQPTPIPPAPGSGSGEQPGSGSGPSPPMGEGMQCSCKCNCPDGGGECECDCNCPMQSSAMNCASGFTRVCPMMGDTCPEDMDMMCPITPMNAQTRMMGNGQAYGEGKGCQCVPDFLMSLVTGMPPAAGRMEATDRMEDFKNEKVKLGKKTCTCSFSLEADGAKCSGTAKCDKKCSGTGVVEVGMYSFTLKMKKGKGAISKCKAEELITLPTQPPTGSGSPQPGSGVGSGTGGGGMGGMGSRCACVAKGMGGSTGSGSGPGPLPPTGSGSGSGPLPPTVAPTGSGSGSGNVTRVEGEDLTDILADMTASTTSYNITCCKNGVLSAPIYCGGSGPPCETVCGEITCAKLVTDIEEENYCVVGDDCMHTDCPICLGVFRGKRVSPPLVTPQASRVNCQDACCKIPSDPCNHWSWKGLGVNANRCIGFSSYYKLIANPNWVSGSCGNQEPEDLL